jgi:hypothetical protein
MPITPNRFLKPVRCGIPLADANFQSVPKLFGSGPFSFGQEIARNPPLRSPLILTGF